jgi:hypothetical protein
MKGTTLSNILVSEQQKQFEGWENVPRDFKTRSAWKRGCRRTIKNEKPSAIVNTATTRALTSTETWAEYTIEQSYKLYHVSQTQAIRRTPLNIAQHEFYDAFIHCADHGRLIRWVTGEWREVDGEKVWDSEADVAGWRTYQKCLGLEDCIAHVNGREIYGVFGAETSCYVLIDLDLHGNPLSQFLVRLLSAI